jgi:hypothetical protein
MVKMVNGGIHDWLFIITFVFPNDGMMMIRKSKSRTISGLKIVFAIHYSPITIARAIVASFEPDVESIPLYSYFVFHRCGVSTNLLQKLLL